MEKAASWLTAMVLTLSTGAAELILPPEALELFVPYGKYYTQSVISYRGNAIRIGKVPGLQIQSLFCLSELKPGGQRLRFTGRAFSRSRRNFRPSRGITTCSSRKTTGASSRESECYSTPAKGSRWPCSGTRRLCRRRPE